MLLPLLLLQAVSSHAQIAVTPGSISTSLPVIPKDFCGFGFDAEYLPYFSVPYSANLINSVAAITGTTPIIRAGGTTADNFVYNASQMKPEVNHKSIGPSFFNTFDTFKGAKFIFQVPLHTMNVDNAVAYGKAGINHIGIGNIQSIAIGNEPNLYSGALAVTPKTYASKYLTFQSALTSAVPSIPTSTPIFEVYDVSSGGAGNPSFTAQEVFANGIDKNGLVNNCASHLHWEARKSPVSDLQTQYLNHTYIANRMSQMYAKDAAYIAKNHADISFVISEASDSLIPDPLKLTSVLGSALWQVDAQLYGMTIGINRVNFQQKQAAPGNLWNPTSVGGKVVQGTTAPFYAQPFVATLIGPNGSTRVKEVKLGLSGTKADHFSAYAAYDGSNLARVALLNLVTWDGSGTRPTQKFAVKVPSGTTKVTVERLNSPDGTSATGDSVSFAGIQYTFTSNGKPTGSRNTETVNVGSNNVATITTGASQAVLVSIS